MTTSNSVRPVVAVPVVSPVGKTQEQIVAEQNTMLSVAQQVRENMFAYQDR